MPVCSGVRLHPYPSIVKQPYNWRSKPDIPVSRPQVAPHLHNRIAGNAQGSICFESSSLCLKLTQTSPASIPSSRLPSAQFAPLQDLFFHPQQKGNGRFFVALLSSAIE